MGGGWGCFFLTTIAGNTDGIGDFLLPSSFWTILHDTLRFRDITVDSTRGKTTRKDRKYYSLCWPRTLPKPEKKGDIKTSKNIRKRSFRRLFGGMYSRFLSGTSPRSTGQEGRRIEGQRGIRPLTWIWVVFSGSFFARVVFAQTLRICINQVCKGAGGSAE